MAIVKNSIPTCKTKTSKHVKDKDLLKILTATEMEIKCARHLADNDSKVRKSALKMLKKWFTKRGSVLDKDFSILWSGLYVSFWMSDKPLVQEECAESIAALSNVLNSKSALQFFESALSRLSMEWYGIDHLRLDKFLMLVRHLLRKSLQVLAAEQYSSNVMMQFQTIITSILCSGPSVNNLGLKLHLTDIYLEEVAKTQSEDIESATVTQLLQPFIHTICVGRDGRLLGEIVKSVFRQLMRQSDEGLDFVEKYKAWRQMGFPGGDISCMKLNVEGVEADDEEDDEHDEGGATERVLDPRAGRVNVDMPQIKFDAKEISDLLDNGKFDANTTSKHRKIVNKLINEFRTLTAGEFPLSKSQGTVELPQKEKGIVKRSTNALQSFEANLRDDMNKNRKRKKEICRKEDGSNNKRLKLSEKLEPDSNGHVKLNKYKNPKKLVMNGTMELHPNKNDDKILNSLPNSKVRKNNPKRNHKSQVHLDIEAAKYEVKFTRPSGTWYVFKGPETPTRVTSKKMNNALYVEDDDAPQDFTIGDCAAVTTPSRTCSPKSAFKSVEIQGTINCTKGDLSSFTTLFNTVMKADKTVGKTNRANTSKLIKSNKLKMTQMILTQTSHKISTSKNTSSINKHNLIRSSEKKVKIALNLNKSQEIHEHELQIKKSPAIPFDANRKPLKPLLKPQCGRFSMSPINPFAKTVKQRRSLMF